MSGGGGFVRARWEERRADAELSRSSSADVEVGLGLGKEMEEVMEEADGRLGSGWDGGGAGGASVESSLIAASEVVRGGGTRVEVELERLGRGARGLGSGSGGAWAWVRSFALEAGERGCWCWGEASSVARCVARH